MRPTPNHKAKGFTRIELMVVVAIVFVLVSMLLPSHPFHSNVQRISCINNLKQIGVANYIWANDHNGHFPASESVTNGGWREFLTNADQGFLCWTNYAIMADEMGRSTRLVVCPSDERKPAGEFIGGPRTGIAPDDPDFKDNLRLSYFVGVSANGGQPQSLLAGDRNLGGGIKPDRDYGFSPESGQGNDVAIQTNSKAGPVCWSLKIHSAGNSAGAGNILLVDGSAQEVSSFSFRQNWQPNFNPTTNWPASHAPSSPSYRVLFP
jgi:competence protein ComGC